jgi:DNA-3-methyladenine glycosylase II
MYTIEPRGPFSLAETRRFAYVDRDVATTGDSLWLAFCRDRSWEPTRLSVTQRHGRVEVDGDEATRHQVERILGLDVDASSFSDVGDRDPVIARLQAAAPGLRPPLLHSAYEAAVFCILTARRSSAQARRMRAALAERAGTVYDAAGTRVTCLPPPSYLVDPEPVPGLDPVRRERLTAVAQAALDGRLDTSGLAALDPEDARRQLELLPGIGPFSSAIIAARALGHTDYLAGPITELNTLVGDLYALGHPATADELDLLSRAWSPWRTWAQLHIRSVSPRLEAIS